MHEPGVEVAHANQKPHVRNTRRVVAILAVGLFILSLLPMPYLASPCWDVRVATNDGRALAGINVRLVYQNYSTDGRSHEVTLTTDENGRVLFPAQHGRAFLVQRLFYTISSAQAGIHASLGRHAYVFTFGSGYEGDAVTGKYITDWRGTPESMESRIIARKNGN